MLWQAFWTCQLMLLCDIVVVCRASSSEQTDASRSRRRTIIGQFPLCPVGCTSCSEVNGCVTCSSNYYLLLVRNGMRQTGTCTHTCPAGYFGVRRMNYSKCFLCPNHCEACFSRTYCTRCRPPYIAYRGSCIERCPDGLFYANYSKDCREQVDCMVGPWTVWGSCMREGQTCGYKYGITTRSREVLDSPSPNGNRCPSLTESTCCRMQMRRCADLITNNSDLTNERRIFLNTHKRRHRKKNRKYRKQRKRKNRKRKKGKRNKNKKTKNKKNHKRAWGRICRRNVVFNDISENVYLIGK